MKLKPIRQSFEVSFKYELYFTEGVLDIDNPTLKDLISNGSKAAKVLFIIDDGVERNHPQIQEQIRLYCQTHSDSIDFTESLVLPGGEEVKNESKFVDIIIEAVDTFKICRHSFVIAIGGGALIDLVGYAAAIAHRGVRLIRIPTTVLSQNDAAVGVKNGVNVRGKKNFIGSFEPPFAVINDSVFLNTLEQRDWIAGVAEAVKVALIKDERFYQYLRTNSEKIRQRDVQVMQSVIYRCAELHMQHISQGGDPFEKGSSRPLDFGHWSAHKLEIMTDYELRHGEAVAKGMALDIVYAAEIGLISYESADEILGLLKDIGFDLRIPVNTDKEIELLLNGIEEFREHLGGELTITLIDSIGHKKDVHEIDVDIMKNAIRVLNAKAKLKLA